MRTEDVINKKCVCDICLENTVTEGD